MALVDAAAQLAHALRRAQRIDVDPVAEDRVGVLPLHLERVVVQRLHLLERPVLGEAEVEDRPHAVIAEVLRHLRLGVVAHLRVPRLTLQRELLLRLQRIASLRTPVRVDVDQLHAARASRAPAVLPRASD